MINPQRRYSKNEIQFVFFLLIVPVIVLGEFIKVLHRVGNIKIPQNDLDIKQGYVRTTDGKKISIKYTRKFDRCVI